MSLDVYLTRDSDECDVAADWLEEQGMRQAAQVLRDHRGESFFEANITHNLAKMAEEAGIYAACWRPDEHGLTKASQLIPLLRDGLAKLQADPEHFQQFNASNGWGLYEHFVPWVSKYLAACEEHPDAKVAVSR